MEVWILLVVVAQFFNAIVAGVDKYIVSSPRIASPAAYAFYVSILSAFSIFVFLFGGMAVPFTSVVVPSFENVTPLSLSIGLISFSAGLVLFGALAALFAALKRAVASDVIPVVGAMSAIAALLLSTIFLGATLSINFVGGFILLVSGTLVLSHYRFWYKTLGLSILSGFLFGAHFVFLKTLFSETNFDNAFFWSRMGIVATAVFFLMFFPNFRRKLVSKTKDTGRKLWLLILGNKVLAGLASIMILKAVELGDVSIVQALGGLQFAYLLAFAIVFGKGLPQICGEHCSPKEMTQKSVAVMIIVIGFFILFL